MAVNFVNRPSVYSFLPMLGRVSLSLFSTEDRGFSSTSCLSSVVAPGSEGSEGPFSISSGVLGWAWVVARFKV